MKISPIKQNIVITKSQPVKEIKSSEVKTNEAVQEKKHNYWNYLAPLGVILAVGIGIKYYRGKNVKPTSPVNPPKPMQNSNPSNEINNYVTELAKSLGKYLNKDIDAKSLKSVISGEDLLKELEKLEKQNFVASKENIERGIFCADLHSHSLYSDGLASVSDILNQVAEYADKLNKKNGKKFLFALTDHDTCEGVKEALKIISEQPEKFENVKFVTGSELSYLIKSDKTSNPFETSEILVYGFNPFDEKINKYFKNLYLKRENMVKEYISEVSKMFEYADFSLEEFHKIYGKNYIMNYQWKVHNYAQTKNAVAGLAISQNKDKTLMYEEIMTKADRWNKTLYDLRKAGLVPESYGEDSRIMDMCRNKYSPRLENGFINFNCESNFDEIIKIFGNDKNTFGAFAHPYYVTERNSQAENLLNELVSKSNGFIKATESHHQAYRLSVNSDEITNFNDKLVKTNNLIELGGRDNHEKDWISR